MFSFIAAWRGHTDASRELAQDVAAGIDAAYDNRNAAAITMGLHPADLSRQLAGRDPLNLWRLADLGAAFWIAFCVARMGRMGGVVVTAEQLTFIRGLVALPRRLARMVLATQNERRRA